MKAENFADDLFYDMDCGTDCREMAAYVCDDGVMDVNGATYSGAEGIREWCENMRAGFDDVCHQVKKVECEDLGGVHRVCADVVWTGALRNMGAKNKIRYVLKIEMTLVDEHGRLKIKRYKSRVTG
jgi:hypothetical protein